MSSLYCGKEILSRVFDSVLIRFSILSTQNKASKNEVTNYQDGVDVMSNACYLTASQSPESLPKNRHVLMHLRDLQISKVGGFSFY